MNKQRNAARNMFRKRFAIPPEKGGWIWWIGPLVIGAAAAGQLRPAVLAVALGAFAAYCVRQPLTLWIKSWRLASHAEDRRPAAFWVTVYSAVCVLVAVALLLDGNARVLLLAVPALPIFAWHFYLVAQANERRQMLRDVLASLALAIAGTAAYWSCGGNDNVTAVLVWLLPGLQASASVVHMFLRLEQRRWTEAGPLARRLRLGVFPIAHHSANVAIALALYETNNLSIMGVIAFAVCFIEGVFAVEQPQVCHTPRQLGMRQLAVSTVFSLLMCGNFILLSVRFENCKSWSNRDTHDKHLPHFIVGERGVENGDVVPVPCWGRIDPEIAGSAALSDVAEEAMFRAVHDLLYREGHIFERGLRHGRSG